ncbi:hypothetical protein BU25DRAFT_128226 [Macroventuria anomochaeta]|uniref:Uncharacterized protein n=1 Tax=Macroventuria anomochaeta TaxID=301207 RepID=A0ACB6RVD3_9PLEO|nr:uncharacterized protein BU25DRAFT_128226 [Macroventuria anomochaeta]KAF2624894.1 hypothetical protein BU25DRAFT_128226 [Macroventuria anomochaeta]
MSRLLTTTLLASVATAQLTTSIWLPGAANANQSFVASVVSLQDDRTTLSLAFDGDAIETEYYGNGPDLVTVGGTTYVAYEATATDAGSDFAVTVNLACTRENGNAVPTCTATTRDREAENSILASHCSSVTGSCTSQIGPSDFPQSTVTMSGDEQFFLNNYKLVITAGTEKLSASAAATPTGSDAQSTAASGTSSAGSSGSSGAPQATGAASPMRSIAPVLAGMGAAAAFFV